MIETSVIIALLSALSGGVVLSVVQSWGKTRERGQDDGIAIRHELREEVKTLRKQVGELQQTVDDWQSKYWALHAEHVDMRAQYAALIVRTTAMEVELQKIKDGAT